MIILKEKLALEGKNKMTVINAVTGAK